MNDDSVTISTVANAVACTKEPGSIGRIFATLRLTTGRKHAALVAAATTNPTSAITIRRISSGIGVHSGLASSEERALNVSGGISPTIMNTTVMRKMPAAKANQ